MSVITIMMVIVIIMSDYDGYCDNYNYDGYDCYYDDCIDQYKTNIY